MQFNVSRIRRLFPATKRTRYFFNGGICLCSTLVQKAVNDFIAQAGSGYNNRNWEKWMGDVSEAYRLFADLVGADAEEIVAIPNTSVGTSMVAYMINPKSGTNIVLDDLEYNTIYPFTIRAKSGVDMRIVRNRDGYVDTREIESRVDDKTTAIVVSAVSCWNGYRYDLKELSEIAHKNGAYLVVDGAQEAGALRLNVRREGVDFLATCGHKWLLAPPGTGFLYVRKELIERFDPPMPGWMGTTEPWNFEVWQPEYPKTAQRFETGMQNLMLLAAAKASLRFIHELGLDRIEQEILKRSGYLIEKLRDMGIKVYTPIEKEHRAGLVTFLLKNHEALYNELQKNSIVAFHHPDTVVKNMHWTMGGLRVDPTFFNTMEELDELLKFVRKHK